MKIKTSLGLIALLSIGSCITNRSLDTAPEPECKEYNRRFGPDSTVVYDMNSINDCGKYQK